MEHIVPSPRTLLLATLLVFAGPIHAEDKPKLKDAEDKPKLKDAEDKPKLKDAPNASVPLWTQPEGDARQGLGKAARASQRGVFLVGSPDTGHGTAWVVSQRNRLLVTNAHVADLLYMGKGKMFAIPSGTSQLYTVKKVWYHPGVRRFLEGNRTLSVRSSKPADGDVDPRSPDLAVLQLSAEGPDLTFEFPVASANDLNDLFAQSAAIFGFPAHDNHEWPKLGDRAVGTYHDGVISRITDFMLNPGAPESELQFVQYTMSTWSGFSGSPVFLPNGRVVAVHNMARSEKGGNGDSKAIPHGVRVDCLAELLVYHGLEDKVGFQIDKSKVAVERWTKPDQRTERALADYAKAVALVEEATRLVYEKQDFVEGEKKCNTALHLVPNYVSAYACRGDAFNSFTVTNQNRLNDAKKLEFYKLALADYDKCTMLVPTEPLYVIKYCQISTNIGIVTENQNISRNVLTKMNGLLSTESLPNHVRAAGHSARAAAYSLLENRNAAWRDHNEAIRLNPEDPVLYLNRATFLKDHRLGDWGQADRAKAREIRENMFAGLRIDELAEGGIAARANLHKGDIILWVNKRRTRTFVELQEALLGSSGRIVVEFFNKKSQKTEQVMLAPVDGKIGVAVFPVTLP
jgi:S1-C subfamily serine protease